MSFTRYALFIVSLGLNAFFAANLWHQHTCPSTTHSFHLSAAPACPDPCLNGSSNSTQFHPRVRDAVVVQDSAIHKQCMSDVMPFFHTPPIPQLSDLSDLSPHCVRTLQSAYLRDCFNGHICQDWFLYLNYFRHLKRKGFYVDVGANLPRISSSTWFYDVCLGWKGICVEPNPINARMLRKERSCMVFEGCVYSRNASLKLINQTHYQGALGTVTDHVGTTSCTPLGHLLSTHDAPPHIDLLSIDVENAELHVLAGWSISDSPFTFDVILMENDKDIWSRYFKRLPFFLRGYTYVTNLRGDDVFVRNVPWLMRDQPRIPRSIIAVDAPEMVSLASLDPSLVDVLLRGLHKGFEKVRQPFRPFGNSTIRSLNSSGGRTFSPALLKRTSHARAYLTHEAEGVWVR